MMSYWLITAQAFHYHLQLGSSGYSLLSPTCTEFAVNSPVYYPTDQVIQVMFGCTCNVKHTTIGLLLNVKPNKEGGLLIISQKLSYLG